jgi:hypothetical protein
MGLFDFNASDPQSYQALKLRQELALRLAGARKDGGGPPKNIGEGIFSAAGDFSDAYKQRNLEQRLAAFEKEYQGGIDNQYKASGGTSSVVPLGNPSVPQKLPQKRAYIDPYTGSAVANMSQDPVAMGELFNTANYGQRDPEDYYG